MLRRKRSSKLLADDHHDAFFWEDDDPASARLQNQAETAVDLFCSPQPDGSLSRQQLYTTACRIFRLSVRKNTSVCFSALFPFATVKIRLLLVQCIVLCLFIDLCDYASSVSFIHGTNAQYFEPYQLTRPASGAEPTAAAQFAFQQQQQPHNARPPPQAQPSPIPAAAFQQRQSPFSGSIGEGVFARQSALPPNVHGEPLAGRSPLRLNVANSQNEPVAENAGEGAPGSYTDQAAAVGFKCREPFGHHAVRQNCSMFIVCVFGNPVVQECQGTTVYNHRLGTCDWPHNSECPAPGDGFFAIGQDAQGKPITGIGIPPPPPALSFGSFPPPPPPPPPPFIESKLDTSGPPLLPPLSSLSNFGPGNSFASNFHQPPPKQQQFSAQPPRPNFYQQTQQNQQQQQQQAPATRPPPPIIQQHQQPLNVRPLQSDTQQQPAPAPGANNSGQNKNIQPTQSNRETASDSVPESVRNSNNDQGGTRQQSNAAMENQHRLTQRQTQLQLQNLRPPLPPVNTDSSNRPSSTLPWWLEQNPSGFLQQQMYSKPPTTTRNTNTAVPSSTTAPLPASSSNIDASKHPWWLEPVQPSKVIDAAASTQEPRATFQSAAGGPRPPSLQQQQQLADIDNQLILREKLLLHQQQQQKQQNQNTQLNANNANSLWNAPSPSQQPQQQKRPSPSPTLAESESAIRSNHQKVVGDQQYTAAVVGGQSPAAVNYNFKASPPPPHAYARTNDNKMHPPYHQHQTIVEHVHVRPDVQDIVIQDQQPFWMAQVASRDGTRLQQVDGGNVRLTKIPTDHITWHVSSPVAAEAAQAPRPTLASEPAVSTKNALQQRSPVNDQRHQVAHLPTPSQQPPTARQPTYQQHPVPVSGRHFLPPPPPTNAHVTHYQKSSSYAPVFSRRARHAPATAIFALQSPMSTKKMMNLSPPSYPEYARPSPLPSITHNSQTPIRKFERFTALQTPAVKVQQKRLQYEEQLHQPAQPTSPTHQFGGRSLIQAAPYVLNFKQQHPQELASESSETSAQMASATTHMPRWINADSLSPTVQASVAADPYNQATNNVSTGERVTYWTPIPTSVLASDTNFAANQKSAQQNNIDYSYDILNRDAANRERLYRQQQGEVAAVALDNLKPWWLDLSANPVAHNAFEMSTFMPATAKPWWIMNWWDAAQQYAASPATSPSYAVFAPHNVPPYMNSRPTAANLAFDQPPHGAYGLPLFAAAPSLAHWLTVPLQSAINNHPSDLFRFSFPLAVDEQKRQPDSVEQKSVIATTTTTEKSAHMSRPDQILPREELKKQELKKIINSTAPSGSSTSNMTNEKSTWDFISLIEAATTTSSPSVVSTQQYETTAPWWQADPPLYGTLAPSFEWSPWQQSPVPDSKARLKNISASSGQVVNVQQKRSLLPNTSGKAASHAAFTSASDPAGFYAPPIIKHKKSSRPLMVEMNKLFSVKYGDNKNDGIRLGNSKLVMDPLGPNFKHERKPWLHETSLNSSIEKSVDTPLDISVVVLTSSNANALSSNGDAPARTANLTLPFFTTTVVASAADCDVQKCSIPNCRCGSTATPGNFPLNATPQIVLLTFDDALTEQNYQIYQRILHNGTNPNGCPIRATFYISHEWSEYYLIQNLHRDGHEIASHSVSHSLPTRNTSKADWTREIDGQRRILSQFANIPLDELRGMRAPYLQPGGNAQYEMLWEQGYLYDSSLSVADNNPPFWPYTLDFRLPHKCWIPPCPTKSFPGLWQVPLIHWEDLLGYRCAMADACHNPGSAEEVYELLTKNFMRHYTTNRAPFGLFYHSTWFSQDYHLKGFERFLHELLNQPDVWLVSTADAIAWMQQPTPLSHIDQFEPWHCDIKHNSSRRLRPDRLSAERCIKPNVCSTTFRGGMRYMRTCAACPEEYPWLGNPTGARQSVDETSSPASVSSTPAR